MRDRVVYIDIAKGISICLVAMLHNNIVMFFPEFVAALSLFRMPLFFFLSGLFFSFAAPPNTFFLKKSEALLKPYFSVLIGLFILSFILPFDQNIWGLAGILYGNGETIVWSPMWFLTHLFAVYCFSYLLFRYTSFNRLSTVFKAAVLLVFLFLGSALFNTFWQVKVSVLDLNIVLPGLPFSVDIILISSFYFIAGYLLKDKIIHFTPNNWHLWACAFVYLAISIFTNTYTNFAFRNYSSPILGTLGAAAGIYLVICLSWYLVKFHWISKVFLLLGSSSLYILIFHGWLGTKAFSIAAGYAQHSSSLLLLVAAACYLFSLAAPLVIKWAVDRNAYLGLFFLPLKSNKLFSNRAKI